MQFHLRRSVLYVPADNERAIAKARSLPADAIIFDLEDAVAPEAKARTREALRVTLSEARFRCEVAVRVNALDTEWATEDILAAIAMGVDALVIPKVQGPSDLRIAADALTDADAADRVALWAMVETPRALLRIAEIAALAAEPGIPLRCLVLGTNDIVLETRVAMTPDRAALTPWLAQVVLAGRAFGLNVLDGVLNAFRDQPRFEAECRQARMLGMDGKTLIHPSQIEPANRIFSPAAEEIARAETIVTGFKSPENAGKGVIAIGGQMVERLHLLEAERLLAVAAAIKAKATP